MSQKYAIKGNILSLHEDSQKYKMVTKIELSPFPECNKNRKYTLWGRGRVDVRRGLEGQGLTWAG